MSINYSETTDQVSNNKKIINNNPKKFFLVFIILSFITAFLIGGFIIGKEKSEKKQPTDNQLKQEKLSSDAIPDNPANWKVFKIKDINLEFKLPDKLTKKNDWQVYKINGNKGTIICFSNTKSESICDSDILVISSTSSDFEAGREALFSDLQGFSKNKDVYWVNSLNNNKIELENIRFKQSPNENGLEIIKILGTSSSPEGEVSPVPGTPGEGYLGAVVNTKNSKYPGLIIKLNLKSELNEYEFDQILNSIKINK
jgi:hypothetical protein